MQLSRRHTILGALSGAVALPSLVRPSIARAQTPRAYDRLTALFARLAVFDEINEVLRWDEEVVMPAGAAGNRADHLAALAELRHELLTGPGVVDDLAKAEAETPGMDAWQASNLRLMRRLFVRADAVPDELVTARAEANSRCQAAWREVRQNNRFADVAPLLAEVFRLARERGEAMGPALGLDTYDALLDGFQSGLRTANIAPAFVRYEAVAREYLPLIQARQAAEPVAIPLDGPFPIARQQELCERLVRRLGLDAVNVRLDDSAHPFTIGTGDDVRITGRYSETNLRIGLMAALHEGGHALYERGLPTAYARQPVGGDAGVAVHESQALIIEMQAGRSDPYLEWLGPQLLGTFGGDPKAYTRENLVRLWRRVRPSFIRADADEATYLLHITLRFHLERAMINGDLAVADLPGAWNEGMQKLLGITPPNDMQGCLQDIHWYAGLIGYFPSYGLGALAAAQLMKTARRAAPGLDAALAQGEMGPLIDWLRTHVQSLGSLPGGNDLMRAATGRPLDATDFIAHIKARYVD